MNLPFLGGIHISSVRPEQQTPAMRELLEIWNKREEPTKTKGQKLLDLDLVYGDPLPLEEMSAEPSTSESPNLRDDHHPTEQSDPTHPSTLPEK